MLAIGMVFLLAIREIDLSVGWMFNFSAVVRGAADGRRHRSVDRGVRRHRLRRRARPGQRRPRGRPAPAGDHRHARHLFDVPGPVAGRQQRPRRRAADQSQQLLHRRSRPSSSASLPVAALVFVVLAIVMHFVLHRTRFGYRVQAVGSNPEAARTRRHLQPRCVRLQTLVLMGAICGLSGVMYVGFRGAIDPNEGSDFVLVVVAAVIIGGTPLSGGSRHGDRRGGRHADHPGDQQRPDLLRHRRDLEHLRHRRGDRPRGRRSTSWSSSSATGRSNGQKTDKADLQGAWRCLCSRRFRREADRVHAHGNRNRWSTRSSRRISLLRRHL